MELKKLLEADYGRYKGKMDPYVKKYLFLLRKTQCSRKKLTYSFWHFCLKKHRLKRGIELDAAVDVGPGLFIAHPFNITVNDNAKIGANCNIHKGVLIGQENRGSRKGTPIIGNSVWLGINSAVVGSVSVGDDVLIAPNSFVNCDIPSHSIAIGNPCRIIHKYNATESYINHTY